ncbi:MAG: two-component regulator propeller domain-containing protein, partial [bacterium]
MLLSRDGTVWIAGEAGGRGETATGTRLYTDQTGFPLGLSRALHEDADGVLWIGTYRNGLARLERGAGRTDSLVFLTTRDGLAEDVVSTIVE